MISIIKPKVDNRKFRGGTLKNNIKFILINDEYLTKSYVSVSINAGSYYNPENYDGLAHFLEHMLFMGSKKYPQENYFMKKLNEYGGESNAYTSTFGTTYYFNVHNYGLIVMLDIFSRFFIDPLFNKDSISCEIKAVNNEHMKNINNDRYKLYQLILYLADNNTKDLSINKFLTGSVKTLNKMDIREKMIQFYNNYYTSDNISICIASSKSFHEMLNLIETTFGIIKKKLSKKVTLHKPLYTKNMNKYFYLKTLNEIYTVTYLWEIPPNGLMTVFKDKTNRFNDFKMLSYLLNNRSKTSLYYHLKKYGFLQSLNIDIEDEGIFALYLNLTPKGFKEFNYIDHVVFLYLNQIYKLDILNYAKYYQKIAKLNFNYNNKQDIENLCNALSNTHFIYNTKNVFSDMFLITDIKNTETYLDLFKKYINNNYIVIISCNKLDYNDFDYYDLREYDSIYAEIKNIDEFKQSLNTSLCYLTNLNTSSRYLTDLNLVGFDLDNNYLNITINNYKHYEKSHPKEIMQNVWVGTYSKYQEPLIYIWLQLNNHNYSSNPFNYVLSILSCDILNFLIGIHLYKAFDIGYDISFSFIPSTSSIIINLSGLNDIAKINNLLIELNRFILNIESLFDYSLLNYVNNLIITYINYLKNLNNLTPWFYNNILIKNLVYSTYYDNKSLLNAAKNIRFAHINLFLKKILINTNMVCFIYGNIHILKSDLNSKLSGLKFFNKNFKLKLPTYPKTKVLQSIIIKHPSPQEESNFIGYYYYIGKFKLNLYIYMLLFVQIYNQYFFDYLRTKEQLGYLVKLHISVFRNDYYISEKVQSNYNIKFIQQKMKDFNKSLFTYLDSIDFEKNILALKYDISLPENNLLESYAKYLDEISSRTFLFNRQELLLKLIDTLNLDKLKKFVEIYITENNKTHIIIQGQIKSN